MSGDYEAWLSTARHYIETAKLALRDGIHDSAYFNATHSAELALKSLLSNIGYSEDSLKREGHNEFNLFEKIKKSNSYPETLVLALEKLIHPPSDGSTNYVSHTDCPMVGLKCESGQAAQTKYVQKLIAPSDYLSPDDARQKIDLCDELIRIIERFFNDKTA